MSFDSFVNDALRFCNQYSIVVAVAAVVLLVMVYKKPKESFKFALFLLFMAAVFYAIGLFSETLSTGGSNKDQMIYKTKNLVD